MSEEKTKVAGEELEQKLIEILKEAGKTVSTAESCTGGWLAKRLTDVSGSSSVFLGGVVAYTNEVKERILGVPLELLQAHGAVSRPVAEAMAQGVRLLLQSDLGIGITGIAGPSGGTEEKPVGTVHIAVADSSGALHRAFLFAGGREEVRWHSSQAALEMLCHLASR